jgi:hypothetical protein
MTSTVTMIRNSSRPPESSRYGKGYQTPKTRAPATCGHYCRLISQMDAAGLEDDLARMHMNCVANVHKYTKR